ncbi:MAG: Ribonuclease [Pseudomonas citronellolis]|nr:MAG: Ribonuclease [Pseudomonas citronellolis]
MAARANDIYLRHTSEFSASEREYIRGTGTLKLAEWLPILRTTLSVEESMAINQVKGGAIILASGGMCTGGRILHHLKHNLWREECHVLFPGFQARGTLGRTIVDGARSVRLQHQRIAVRAKIHTLGGFSSHAGQGQLIDWASHFEHKPELYLIHGEREKMDVLQGALLQRLQWKANIPEPGERIAI